MKIDRLVAHIPARSGSKRVKSKALRHLAGKPMISYAIECAKACPEIDEIYVNTECEQIAAVAESHGVNVFMRDPTLAGDETSGDDFTIDIINKLNLDTLMLINPVCPLIVPDDVRQAVASYRANTQADTLISVTETKMQVALEEKFINIDPNSPLRPTQLNPTMNICNWAVTIWNAAIFRSNYAAFGGGYCGTNRILFPIKPLNAIKVSYESDFELVDAIMTSRSE